MLNVCILSGHLGADPEIRYSQEGKPIATFSLAFHSGKNKTGWLKVTAFQKLAELTETYLHKGAKISVVGQLEQEKWESNGETRSGFKILANSIEFIKTDGRGFTGDSQDDDLPF
jgi:single-strand DNA-binding protein